MWKDILSLFKGESLCEEAYDEALLMLKTSHGMYKDAVTSLHEIGDYAKNIAELAASLDEAFDGRELADDVHRVEGMIDGIFEDLISALDESDEDRARHVMATHRQAGVILEDGITLLREGKVLSDDSGHAATLTLYLRFLKRMSAHLKNVATSVVNPYYRIGYREKRSD